MRMLSIMMLLGLAACGGSGNQGAEPATPATSKAASAEPQTFAEQVAAGQKLYAANCASCHGAGGEGGKAPRVVGLDKGAFPLDPPATAKHRKTQFKTAADIAGFVVKNMPPGGEPSLNEQDYWSILAFDLHANGVDLPQKIDGTNAKDVVLHK